MLIAVAELSLLLSFFSLSWLSLHGKESKSGGMLSSDADLSLLLLCFSLSWLSLEESESSE